MSAKEDFLGGTGALAGDSKHLQGEIATNSSGVLAMTRKGEIAALTMFARNDIFGLCLPLWKFRVTFGIEE